MRPLLSAGLLVAIVAGSSAAQSAHRITASQADRLARLVARHDQIDLSDTHIEFSSMDLSSDFIPGYSSFIVIREATTPGPDQTLRRYAVNRRTGDVWEMTLCTRYDFPALAQMRRAFVGRATPSASELAAESKELGCSQQKPAPAS